MVTTRAPDRTESISEPTRAATVLRAIYLLKVMSLAQITVAFPSWSEPRVASSKNTTLKPGKRRRLHLMCLPRLNERDHQRINQTTRSWKGAHDVTSPYHAAISSLGCVEC